jgi:membrane-bound ClpP family serine protease
VAFIAGLFGVVLIVLGVVGYIATDREHPTALIPAALGLLLIVLGLMARREKLRMHAMHGAVLVGLIGLVGGGVRAVQALTSGTEIKPWALGMNIAMALICAVFVGLCVMSFIDARRRRQRAGPSS